MSPHFEIDFSDLFFGCPAKLRIGRGMFQKILYSACMPFSFETIIFNILGGGPERSLMILKWSWWTCKVWWIAPVAVQKFEAFLVGNSELQTCRPGWASTDLRGIIKYPKQGRGGGGRPAGDVQPSSLSPANFKHTQPPQNRVTGSWEGEGSVEYFRVPLSFRVYLRYYLPPPLHIQLEITLQLGLWGYMSDFTVLSYTLIRVTCNARLRISRGVACCPHN